MTRPATRTRAGARGGRSKGASTRPKRMWLWVPVGVVLAAWAVWGLMTIGSGTGPVKSVATEPSGEIGDASRARLREILRAADDEDAGPSAEAADGSATP